ncbi:MEDS domain-containing protein [Planococcus plakortidis]|uniref:MEDS domain-containing protein n=1 Tax=Planococcus plakortidis TaxID=1038856 RepID=UPI00385DA2DD
MNQKMSDFTESLRVLDYAHILYLSEQADLYIENAVTYILNGIRNGDRVLFVENPRIYPQIHKKLQQLLSAEELGLIHYVNNFDFYWRKGNFHPDAILEYFESILGAFAADGRQCRTWGHIEWASQQDIDHKIIEYETEVDRSMPQRKSISVCAYDAPRVSDSLRERLMLCHGYLMEDSSVFAISFHDERKARN